MLTQVSIFIFTICLYALSPFQIYSLSFLSQHHFYSHTPKSIPVKLWSQTRLRLLLPLRAFPSCLHFATIFNHNAQSRSHRIHLFRYLVFYIFVNFHVLRLFCALCLLFPRFLVLLDFVFNVWIVWSESCCAIHVAID